MSNTLPKSIERLIVSLSQLPGIGPKTASRLVFYLIRNNQVDLRGLGEAVTGLKDDLVYCGVCHNIADSDPCVICADKHRQSGMLCVVEEPLDVLALERAGFTGLYHVLGGSISPLEGVGPNELQINSLVERLKANSQIKEVIIATNPDVEGEATAAYLIKLLQNLPVSITRIARGLPMGGDLEYADELTLSRALEGRNPINLNAKV
ncbi:TPA: recombination protein RecR [Patescibacteria group bacterium]|uniref:Recombination protein RecR n=2 Tax=Bacteria division Kazan-3B-28 TaxID=1798534 RepID=A0A0G1X795_UNCK3|nr:MAG: recombination protein RecR, recombination protein RecR [candidate division Kazan bacterium GW2011_GWA1_50_15]KKW25550.1 MAG: Recombination protein RecR [candidate division Kazan bacterium GW2011_GWC1_52_13]KKW26856.1 MAG: Recombination protein RecR [candidate division Kazan bacterium GW2011_GWB1_52_7]HAV65849.1 recombination protein RecR [Patescibacteria group bacterium]HCL47828.1 recombination protein RecR [Patescibacteria group bacterium]